MSEATGVSFLDLVTPHRELRQDLHDVYNRVLDGAAFVGGRMVEAFEEEFAAFCEARHCVGVSSGTDALRFALIAAGVPQGDIVVTVPNTFIATVEAISQAGANVAFVDVDERTYNMDPRKLHEYLNAGCYVDAQTRKLIDRRTGRPVSAILPVHLYGQTADMDSILEIADRYGLIVIEDACQAHGAEYFSKRENRWKKAGSMGKAAAFSFYPGKNLGACGEGGAATTNDREVAKKIRMLRDHGQAKKYYHDMEGYNGRLDALQAGILSVKLRHLAEWNHQRRACAAHYGKALARLGEKVGLPTEPSWSRAVYHLYVIRQADRQGLQAHMATKGVGTGIHYPIPLHLQKAYETLGYGEGDFPVSERVAKEILSLPMYPQLRLENQQTVAEALAEFVENKQSFMAVS